MPRWALDMTIAKSLKYEPEQNGKGHVHRTHRSPKGRKYKGRKYLFSVDRKRKLEALKLKDLEWSANVTIVEKSITAKQTFFVKIVKTNQERNQAQR